MIKYKYITVKTKAIVNDVELNGYGEKGWELISVIPNEKYYNYIYRLAIDEDNKYNTPVNAGIIKMSVQELYENKLLSCRAINILRKLNCESVADMMENSAHIMNLRKNEHWGLGDGTLVEIHRFMKVYNLNS